MRRHNHSDCLLSKLLSRVNMYLFITKCNTWLMNQVICVIHWLIFLIAVLDLSSFIAPHGDNIVHSAVATVGCGAYLYSPIWYLQHVSSAKLPLLAYLPLRIADHKQIHSPRFLAFPVPVRIGRKTYSSSLNPGGNTNIYRLGFGIAFFFFLLPFIEDESWSARRLRDPSIGENGQLTAGHWHLMLLARFKP